MPKGYKFKPTVVIGVVLPLKPKAILDPLQRQKPSHKY